MFRHPKYYKELRKRNRELRASTALPSVPQSDQAISKEPATAGNQRSPGPGLKQRDSTGGVPGEADISVTSVKLQAPGVKLSNQPVQAASDKHQAPSSKHQATSLKQQAP